MGKFATRKILKEIAASRGIKIYRHRLDGASFQYCAAGYVVNGYGRPEEILYDMQKELISLLETGRSHYGNKREDLISRVEL